MLIQNGINALLNVSIDLFNILFSAILQYFSSSTIIQFHYFLIVFGLLTIGNLIDRLVDIETPVFRLPTIRSKGIDKSPEEKVGNLGIGGGSCYSRYGLAWRFPRIGECLVGANASTDAEEAVGSTAHAIDAQYFCPQPEGVSSISKLRTRGGYSHHPRGLLALKPPSTNS